MALRPVASRQSLCQQVSTLARSSLTTAGLMELRVRTLLREACAVRASAPRPRRSGRLSWHREKSPPRARRRAVMALNLASGNFDARPTAGLARASTCSTEPVPASQHPCMQLLNDSWTHGAARAHVAPRSMRCQGFSSSASAQWPSIMASREEPPARAAACSDGIESCLWEF